MILIYKNKGILVPLYFIVSLIVSALLFGAWLRWNGYFALGMACLFSAGWTYATRNDYYKDAIGNKVKVDIRNEFFWISMITWAKILLIPAVVFISVAMYDELIGIK